MYMIRGNECGNRVMASKRERDKGASDFVLGVFMRLGSFVRSCNDMAGSEFSMFTREEKKKTMKFVSNTHINGERCKEAKEKQINGRGHQNGEPSFIAASIEFVA